MELTQHSPDIDAPLAADVSIDRARPQAREAATRLARDTDAAYARAAFEFVPDAVPHSADSGNPRVTWRASDVPAAVLDGEGAARVGGTRKVQ